MVELGPVENKVSWNPSKLAGDADVVPVPVISRLGVWVTSCSVAKSCPTLCNSVDCSMPGFPVLHHLLEFAPSHFLWITDVIQPSHPLCPLLLLPSIFPIIRVFSNNSTFCIRWAKCWSFSISPSNEYSALSSFRIDWVDLLAVQGTLKSSKVTVVSTQPSLWSIQKSQGCHYKTKRWIMWWPNLDMCAELVSWAPTEADLETGIHVISGSTSRKVGAWERKGNKEGHVSWLPVGTWNSVLRRPLVHSTGHPCFRPALLREVRKLEATSTCFRLLSVGATPASPARISP